MSLHEKTQKVFYGPITKAVLLGQSKGKCQRTVERIQASTLTQDSKGLTQHPSGTEQSNVYKLGELLESSQAEKDLGVLTDEKLNVSQQGALAAQKANRILCSLRTGVASRARDVIVLLCSALVRLHLKQCPSLGPPKQEGGGIFGESPEKAKRIIQGLEHLSYEDKLKELALFSQEKRRLGEDFIAAFQYLKTAYKHEGNQLFTWANSDRSRGNFN